MRLRTLIQNALRSVLPDDPPGAGRPGDLINTGSLNDETFTTESPTTYAVPPSYSNLPTRTLPPSYSDLYPTPLPRPAPISASRPVQTRESKPKSSSRPRPIGLPYSAASTTPPCTIATQPEARRHDKSFTILSRLPDRIMRVVIYNLDNCSIECLRRVSRRYTPLCNEQILTRPYTFQPRWKLSDREGPFAWPRFRAFDGSHAWRHIAKGEQQRFLQLLARDGYCWGCRRARESPGWGRRVERLRRYLYCHSCKADHPACLFSTPQRRVPARHRRCIAHEGYFRLCQHDEGIVRWSDISRIRAQLKDGGEHEDDCSIRCEDASHVVSCTQTGAQRSGRRVYLPDCYNAGCVEWPMPELRVDASTMKLRWAAHMPIQDNGRPLTESDLRLQIAEIREKGGRFLYPATAFEQEVPEMRCFDSNECDCLSVAGAEAVESRPGPPLTLERVCETNFSRKLPQNGPGTDLITPWPLPSAASSIREQLRAHKSVSPRACESLQKMHTARWYFFGPAQVKVACWPCHAGDFCLVLDYTRVLTVGRDGAIDEQWYQALDPNSYNLTEDQEGFEVYWCRDNKCRNYYGRVPGFRTIVAGAEYHRPVYSRWFVEAHR